MHIDNVTLKVGYRHFFHTIVWLKLFSYPDDSQ